MQIIAGLLEAVSILLCIFVVLKLGLKINLVIYMVFAGVGCLAVNFLPDGNYFGVITFAMIGKCCWRWIFMFMYRVYVRAGRLYIHTTLYSRSHLFIWEYLLYIYVSMETHTRIWPRFCIYRTNWVSQCGNGFSHLFSKLYLSTRTWKLTSQISLTFQNQLAQSCKDTVTVWLYRNYPSHYDFGTVTIFGINELWTRLQKKNCRWTFTLVIRSLVEFKTFFLFQWNVRLERPMHLFPHLQQYNIQHQCVPYRLELVTLQLAWHWLLYLIYGFWFVHLLCNF